MTAGAKRATLLNGLVSLSHPLPKSRGTACPGKRVRQPAFNRSSIFSSNELNAFGGEHYHPQKQPTVRPSLDVSGAVRAILITDRQVKNLQIQFGSAEE